MDIWGIGLMGLIFRLCSLLRLSFGRASRINRTDKSDVTYKINLAGVKMSGNLFGIKSAILSPECIMVFECEHFFI